MRDEVSSLQLDDFVAYMPGHKYFFIPTREPWPAASVNARIKPVKLVDSHGNPLLDDEGNEKFIAANQWLDQNRPVEQMTWAPGEPLLIRDRLVDEGGFIDRKGSRVFNLYRPPPDPRTRPSGDVTPWLDHIEKLYGDATAHTVRWLAHRVQRPAIKINHALYLGGPQGIGKDTLLEPARQAVGPWNCAEVSPQQLMGRWNGFLKSVLLRVSEGRDLGEFDRYKFYDHSKTYIAAPPETLRIDEKFVGIYSILNVSGVIITSNYKSNGLYLPADDRRHFVAWSDCTKEDFEKPELVAHLRRLTGCTDETKQKTYWQLMWHWYEHGGYDFIANYLATLDLTGFDPKAPPPKTVAFWSIVDASRPIEDAELRDVIDGLKASKEAEGKTLDVITLKQIIARADADDNFSLVEWLRDRKNAPKIPHRLESCHYVPARNPDADDGLWRIDGKRQAVYARSDLDDGRKQEAAAKLARQSCQ